MKKILVHFILLIVAIVVVFGIAHYTKIEVNSKEDLRTLSCGWPLEFVLNNQDWRDPPYPWKIKCLAGEWGDPIKISWHSFFINVFVFYFGFAFLWEALSFVRRRKSM